MRVMQFVRSVTFDKHNDDFMADGLNTLKSASVSNWYLCFGFVVTNVAEFLCRAVEKLLFFSEAQSQYLRQLPKKPILLECWARNLLVCVIQTKIHKKIHWHFSLSIKRTGKRRRAFGSAICWQVIVLSRRD